MPIKPTEMERIILADGWIFKNQTGSHRHYIHPSKPGKVTIPFHKASGNQIIIRRYTHHVINISGMFF